MISRIKYIIFALFFCVSGNSISAVIHINEISFQSATVNLVVENFESLDVGESTSTLSGLSGHFLPLNNGELPVGYAQTSGGTARSGVRTLLNSSVPNFPGRGALIFVANSGFEFESIGYWNTGGDDTTRLSIFNKEGNLIESDVSEFGEKFLGYTDLVGATRAEILGETGNGWFSIDDFQTHTVSSVPLPPSLTLFATSLLGILYKSRRTR